MEKNNNNNVAIRIIKIVYSHSHGICEKKEHI